ncbi:MAG TPA: glycosyltransferase family 39 protein, partial [Chloroflexota bacterium]|nr:glycosyltransferase family 39 protein [Chloroflexota bacterium]
EAFFIYFQALLVAGAGAHLLVFTYAAVAMGMLSVALSYRLFRTMFGQRVGLICAGLMAVALWEVALSHVGLRFSSLPPFVLAVLYLLWRTLHTGRWRYAAFAGIAIGGSLYTYTSSRLVPLLVLLVCLLEWRLARKRLPQLAMGALIATAVFAPEGVYFLGHPDAILGRAAQVSVFSPNPQVERGRDTPMQSVLKTAGMFFVHGDEDQRGNIPGRPVFDPPMAVFFLAGLGLALWRLRGGSAYRWLLAWLFIMCLPSALSQSSPDQFRVYSVAPAAFALAALGLEGVVRLVRSRAFSGALPFAAIAWTCGWTAFLYFGVWAHDPKTYEAFGGGAYRLASFLAGRPEQQLYLAFHDRWPIEVLTPKTLQAHWYREGLAAVPLPRSADSDALFVAAPFAALAHGGPRALPGLTSLPHTTAASGVPDFLAFRWPAADIQRFLAAEQPLGVSMAPDFRLAAYSLSGDGSARMLNLFWRPLAASGPYDLYVHLVDASGKQVAQADVQAWPVEDGPQNDYVLLTQCLLNVPPGSYTAEAGAVHRAADDPSKLVGGPIGQVARIPLELPASGN